MTTAGGDVAAPPLPSWGVRLTAPVGRLPLGAIFGAIGVAGAAAVGVLHLERLPFSVCIFKAMTGLPCPTCGSTRAVAHLVHLDLAGALAMNPLTTFVVAVVALWALADVGLLTRGRALEVEVGPPLGRLVRVGAIAALVANWGYLLAAGR